MYIVYYWICQFKDYAYWLMTGLFAWISLAALSRDLFFKVGIDVNISLNH